MIVHLTLGLLLAFMPTMKDEQEELPEIVSEVYEQEEVSEDDLKFELQEQIVASDQMMVDAVAPSVDLQAGCSRAAPLSAQSTRSTRIARLLPTFRNM